MARNVPDTVPTNFADGGRLEDAYRRGWNHGHGIACHNVPTLGETYFTESDGRVKTDKDNIRDVHESLCYSSADNSRSYSPFEFTAHEFNEAGEGGWFALPFGEAPVGPFETKEEALAAVDVEGFDEVELFPSSDELWEAFEAGTGDAIFADLAEYTDEDYGIEAEEDDSEEA